MSARTSSAVSAQPRWQKSSVATAGLANRECKVPAIVAESVRRVEAGLADALHYWQSLADEFADYVGGPVGMNDKMRGIFETMPVAWCFKDMVAQPEPSPRHEDAVYTLYRILEDDLNRIPWPPDSFNMQPSVKQWPHTRAGLLKMYRRWWRNIHGAANRPESAFRQKWRAPKCYLVLPLLVPSQVYDFCRQWMRNRKKRNKGYINLVDVAAVASCISGFLYSAERGVAWPLVRSLCDQRLRQHPNVAWNVFGPMYIRRGRISQSRIVEIAHAIHDLLPPPGNSPFLINAADVEILPNRNGTVARLSVRSRLLRRRLVQILRIDTALDEEALVSSLEQSPQLATFCYHVNTMCCFTRRMGGTESPCENYGSDLNFLYNPTIGPTTTTLCQQLRCRAAGLRGDGLDDAIVEKIALPLYTQVKGIRRTRKTLTSIQDPDATANVERCHKLAFLHTFSSAPTMPYGR
jgi:hypothetical protein